MAYDDVKEFEGHRYTGMPVGGQHEWVYRDGVWRERKVAPDKWEFTFSSLKERATSAPVGSGVPPRTQYHWYILADQRVRKVDEDSYETLMAGVKYKIAHRRPHWRRWSSEYPDQLSARQRILAALEATIAEVRGENRTTDVTDRIPPELQASALEAPPRRIDSWEPMVRSADSSPRARDLGRVGARDAIVEV